MQNGIQTHKIHTKGAGCITLTTFIQLVNQHDQTKQIDIDFNIGVYYIKQINKNCTGHLINLCNTQLCTCHTITNKYK